MKRFFVLILAMILLSFSAFAAPVNSAKGIGGLIQRIAPSDFGYIDSTEYYFNHYFQDLCGVDAAYIITCADSTNFNEIGVFHVDSDSCVKDNVCKIQKYLDTAKSNFESGVMYNPEEYSKFKNAKVEAFGNYIVYTILDKEPTKRVYSAISEFIKNGV